MPNDTYTNCISSLADILTAQLHADLRSGNIDELGEEEINSAIATVASDIAEEMEEYFS